jgi:hypothetical protein
MIRTSTKSLPWLSILWWKERSSAFTAWLETGNFSSLMPPDDPYNNSGAASPAAFSACSGTGKTGRGVCCPMEPTPGFSSEKVPRRKVFA